MLTDRQIKTLPTTGKPYRKRDKSSDPGLKGFGMQVSAAGSKERQKRLEQHIGRYEDLVRLYLGTVKNPTTRTEISRLFEKDAKPELREMRVTDIEPTDIRRVLDRASKRGAKRVPWMLHS
jgi:hypothetical protein